MRIWVLNQNYASINQCLCNHVLSMQLFLHLMINLKRKPVFLKANKEIDSCLFYFSEWCKEAKEYEISSHSCSPGDWVNGYKNCPIDTKAVCGFRCSCQNEQPLGDAFISITHTSRFTKCSQSKSVNRYSTFPREVNFDPDTTTLPTPVKSTLTLT